MGLQAAALRLPFLPTRAGLGSDVLAHQPDWLPLRCRSPYDDAEELVAMPALQLDAAIVHINRADAAGNGQILGPDPFFDDLFCVAAKRRFVSCERVVPTENAPRRGARCHAAHPPHDGRRRGRGPGGAALHRLPAGLRARRGIPEGVRRERARTRRVGGVPRDASSAEDGRSDATAD